MPEQKRSKRRARLAERNEAIRAEFKRQWDKGYRTAYIIAGLEKTEHLDAITLEAIVFRKGVYKEF